jgi:hypothetical protein
MDLRRKSYIRFLLAGVILLVLAGCGGGEGGTAAPPTKAVVKVIILGTIDTGAIKGVEVTLCLPDGVTVGADDTGKTDDGVVVASGEAAGGDAYVSARYTTAAGSESGMVKAVIVKTSGFGAGEFLTVNCDLPAGGSVSSTDFNLLDFKPVDENGAAIEGLDVAYTVEIR